MDPSSFVFSLSIDVVACMILQFQSMEVSTKNCESFFYTFEAKTVVDSAFYPGDGNIC
jgi:hypothetical protein